MNQLFDIFDRPEPPSIILCNPDKSELFSLGTCYDRKLSIRYNSLSEFTFTAPKSIEGVDQEYYDYLKNRRLVRILDTGITGIEYFIITGITEDNDGIIATKSVTCASLEAELSNKKINVFSGTYEFYDLTTPTGTLLDTLVAYAPGWTIGDVDATLLTKYRTFDVSSTSLYRLLMEDVERAYQCVFTFDSDSKTINAYDISTATSNTDIFVSYNNLIEKINISEVTDELVTALDVYGGGNLDILTVNPLGTPTIYNFDSFKTTEWMSQGLIDAIDAWEALIVANQATYASTLTNLKDENATLLTLQSDLAELEAELAALEGVQKAQVQQGLSISATNTQIIAKKVEITNKEGEITSSQSTISSLTATLTAINAALSFSTNFTSAQIIELSPFIIGSTYQNENFIQTTIMTSVEIQEAAQDLYDQAQDVLTKVSVPRYTFTIDMANFVFLKEFETFTEQLQFGSIISLEIRDDVYAYPVFLGIDMNYDDPTDFAMTFSNRLRLDGSDYIFSDLFGNAVSQAINTSFNSELWTDWTNNYQDSVSSFITSSLDASLNNVISATNQEIKIDGVGLRGKTYLPSTGTYDPEQVWLTSNTLAFTEDNWDTASLALGKITTPTGGTAYGLVAEAVFGRLLAGNELTITNSGGNFTLDSSGATLTDATFTVTKSDNKSRIFLDPLNGILIQGKPGGSWVDKFKADSSGNIIFSGTLSGADGTFSGTVTANTGLIGGWTINSSGFYKDANTYIYSNGNMKMGGLYISGTTAIFNGTIYASNLGDQISNGNIANGAVSDAKISSLNAGKVTAGTMSADRIYGGTIYFNGGSIGLGSGGFLTLTGNSSVNITGGGTGQVYCVGNTLQLNGSYIPIGSGTIDMNGTTYIRGNIYANYGGYNYFGSSEDVRVYTSAGYRTFYFRKGLYAGKSSS